MQITFHVFVGLFVFLQLKCFWFIHLLVMCVLHLQAFPQVIHVLVSILCVKRIAFQLELHYLNHIVWAAGMQKVFFSPGV